MTLTCTIFDPTYFGGILKNHVFHISPTRLKFPSWLTTSTSVLKSHTGATQALRRGCDHNDAEGDGKYDDCMWDYLNASLTYEYRYDENWQLTKCTETLQNGIITEYDYQYDKDGNRSKYVKTVNGEWTECYTYEYTAENRLAVVKEQGTVLMAALYDGDGNRLLTMDYTITEYVNDVTRENEEVLAELNHRGKVTTAYTYGYTRESADVYGDIQYYLYDGQGNVSRISSEWGRVKETYVYDPYGNLTYGIPDTVNYYGYNGESSNLATGLQYLRARYYNPQNGNFITEDTYAGQVSNPLILNRYDYVSNNPLNYIDPSGHYSLEQFGKDVGNFFGGIYDAFQRGYDIQQQNQQYEQQIMSDFYDKVKEDGKQALSDAWNKITTVNQQQKELEQTIMQIQTDIVVGGGAKAVEPIVEVVTDIAQINYTAQVQKQQAEEELRQAFCEMLEEYDTELKYAAGGLVITGAGAIAIISHGAVTQPLIGSIIGGIVGGFMHYALAEEGEDAIDEAADGFMWGTINGAACATVGQFLGILSESLTALQNPLVLSYMEGLLETAVEEFMLILQGENLTVEGVGYDLLLNIFTSGENPRMKDLADGLESVMKKLGDWFDDTAAKIKNLIKGGSKAVPNMGFDDFTSLKKYMGDPGDGNAWHHIVEQSQIGKRANFDANQVHNVNNIIAIPAGADSIHSKISAHYSSKFDFTDGLTVRDWLSTKSFDEQFEYGKELLEEYGEVIATDNGWIFKPY